MFVPIYSCWLPVRMFTLAREKSIGVCTAALRRGARGWGEEGVGREKETRRDAYAARPNDSERNSNLRALWILRKRRPDQCECGALRLLLLTTASATDSGWSERMSLSLMALAPGRQAQDRHRQTGARSNSVCVGACALVRVPWFDVAVLT